MSNEHLDAVKAELETVGIKYAVRHGGKHLHINWTHEGADRTFVIPNTPSDRRGWMNSRTDLRRILKQDGLICGAEAIEWPRTFLRDQSVFVSSLDMARHFDKAHKDVLRAIDRVREDIGDRGFTERNFAPSTYQDATGRALRCFDLSRDGFSLVAMGFTGAEAAKWKVSYITAFNAMEGELLRLVPAEMLQKIGRLEADLSALIDLSLETPRPRVRKQPFVRPSVVRRMKRMGRAA